MHYDDAEHLVHLHRAARPWDTYKPRTKLYELWEHYMERDQMKMGAPPVFAKPLSTTMGGPPVGSGSGSREARPRSRPSSAPQHANRGRSRDRRRERPVV